MLEKVQKHYANASRIQNETSQGHLHIRSRSRRFIPVILSVYQRKLSINMRIIYERNRELLKYTGEYVSRPSNFITSLFSSFAGINLIVGLELFKGYGALNVFSFKFQKCLLCNCIFA